MNIGTVMVLLISGVALLDATLFLAYCLRFKRRKARVRQQALELAESCKKLLKSVEPQLAEQVRFSPHVEIQTLGRFPWQKSLCLVLGVKNVPKHKTESLRMTVWEGMEKYLKLPAHLHLCGRMEINSD